MPSPTTTRLPLAGRLGLVCIGVALGLVASLALVRLLNADLVGSYARLESRLIPTAPLGRGLLRPSAHLGAEAIPLGEHRHRTSEFDVVYRIDEKGGRRVPGNDYSRPIVEFLGDSFTFGHGVADEDTYSAVLRERYWPNVAIRNRALMGWSMAPSAIALEEDLHAYDDVSLVVYGWLGIHDERSFEFLHGSEAPFPEWLLDVKRRLVDPIPRDARGDETVWRQVGQAILSHMAAQARERGTPFWVVILALPGWAPQEQDVAQVIPFLEREGIPYIDLQHDPRFASRESLQFPIDQHPTPAYHGLVADALAERIRPEELQARAQRRQAQREAAQR